MGNFFKNIGDALTSGISNVVAGLGQGKVDPWSVGLSAASGLFSSLGQDRANKQYMNQQLALMDKQQAFTREMFDLQQQANKTSIIDQFNQYRQLGINPLSTQGGLSQANVSAPSAPSAPSPQYQSPLEAAQVELAKSQAAKNYAEANAIDPEEAKSRTEVNRTQSGYTRELTKTEKGLRRYRIADASANVTLTVEKANLTKKEQRNLDKTFDVLDAQIREANANSKLLDEKAATEVFNRNQTEIMNRATREHWSRQDKSAAVQANAAMKQVSLGFARLDFEKQQWNEAGLDVQKKQAEYLTKLAETVSKDTELKDIQLDYENGVFAMKVMAGNAQLRYVFNQSENGSLYATLDTEWMHEHGSKLYDMRTVEVSNAIICGYLDNNPFAHLLDKAAGYGRSAAVGAAVGNAGYFRPNNYRAGYGSYSSNSWYNYSGQYGPVPGR